MRRLIHAALALLLLAAPAAAQAPVEVLVIVVAACGTPPPGLTYTPGQRLPLTMDTTGTLCTPAGGGGGGGGAVTVANGADVTQGAKGDAKSTATDTTPITAMSVWKQISSSVQSVASSVNAIATSVAGTLSVSGTFWQATQPTSVADAGHVTMGAKADAKSTATDTTAITAMSVWKQISASVQAIATSIAGTLTVATHAVTQSGTWTIQPGNTANTTPWLATQTPAISGGLSTASAIIPNNTTSVALKASAGQLYDLDAFSISAATPVYVKFYDAAQGSTTCGSGTPKLRYMVPASGAAAGGGFVKDWPNGVPFATAITYCITAALADNDTTAPAASTYVANFGYK